MPDVGPEDIEGLFVGAVQPERFAFQTHVAPLVAELLGIEVDSMIARTELACASGQAALRYAWLAITIGDAVEELKIVDIEGPNDLERVFYRFVPTDAENGPQSG